MNQIPIPKWVVRRIRAVNGLEVDEVSPGALQVTVRGGCDVSFRVIRGGQRLSAAEAKRLAAGQLESASRFLVVAEAIPRAARNALLDGDVSWLDRQAGSHYLAGPGLLVSQPQAEDAPRVQAAASAGTAFPRLQGKAGVVAEALLAWPASRPVDLGGLAGQARVSKPLVSRILARLVAIGVARAEGAAPHRDWAVADPDALFDLWVEEGAALDSGGVNTLYLWTAGAEERYRKLALLSQHGVDWALGGVAAANAHAPHLSELPDPEIWLSAEEPIARIAGVLGSEQVDRGGNLVIRQEDRNLPLVLARTLSGRSWREGLRAVSPERAAAEAMTAPGRGPEVAAHLRGEISREPE